MLETIKNRRSIRKFKKDVLITKGQLDILLEAAMLAPSACNSRPWEFVAITKREVLDEIANIHPYAAMCQTASAAIVISTVPQEGIAEGYYPQDGGAAAQNILLAAYGLGLGTCWCGIYPREERIDSFRKLLDIKEPAIPFAVIAIGVSDEAPEARGFFEESKVRYIV